MIKKKTILLLMLMGIVGLTLSVNAQSVDTSLLVHKANTETITGAKTFTGSLTSTYAASFRGQFAADAIWNSPALGLKISSGDYTNYLFTYDGFTVSHYGIGFYNDTQNTVAPWCYLSGYAGIKFFTAGRPNFYMGVNGSFGIGTITPLSKLDVTGGVAIGSYAGTSAAPANGLIVNGNVGIGTGNPGAYMLAVKGNVHAQQVNVDLNGWADYVFNKNYTLPTLTEVKTYIDQNHHLPEIPSKRQIIKDGLNLGEMNKLLVKKVEELTLYLIEQQKTNQELKDRLNKLEEKLNTLNSK
ncbi:MAG TPA: hypothetical protein VGI43_01380 [Mucilaginibacter sp.]|jgi:hypothetical protein